MMMVVKRCALLYNDSHPSHRKTNHVVVRHTKEYLSSSTVVPGTEEANERMATAAAESYQLSGGIEL